MFAAFTTSLSDILLHLGTLGGNNKQVDIDNSVDTYNERLELLELSTTSFRLFSIFSHL